MLNEEKIKFLIVHCSDTPDHICLQAKDIHKMHLGFGWDGIGYHKVICKDGEIQLGRPEYWIGAHVYGKNTQSLGVCLIGRENFSKLQFISLRKVLIEWKKKYPLAKILGHCEVIETTKTCPNFDLQNWLKNEKIDL